MLTRVQAKNFRSLRWVDQSLGDFAALVGPNASGKTTFLDTIDFLGDLMRNRGEVLETVTLRSANFKDMIWMGKGHTFQIAVEASIPDEIRSEMAADKKRFGNVRYEIEIGLDREKNEVGLNQETLWLIEAPPSKPPIQRDLFPASRADRPSLLSRSRKDYKAAITKKPGRNDNYYTEGKKSYMPSFKLGRARSALANIPADPQSFPVSTWFKSLLEQGIQSFVLNSQVLRQPSPPGLGRRFQPNGSNLPWVIAELRSDRKNFKNWLNHVRTALSDISDVLTVERPEDKHRYIVVEYQNGARVPSWLVSDGTLRLFALTVPAYLEGLPGTFLIEEPENGIHPRAIETVIQSLTSIYGSQVLLATHSPIALNMLEPSQVLCFAKDSEGATDIVSGSQHPSLREWKSGKPDLGTLFAAGILS